MHGLDGAAGHRIETCRLCACTAQPLLRPKQLPGPRLACWTLTPFFSAPSGVSPASVFRVSLFPATLCFAVFRVSEFGRGCEGPCFVFRVSDFPRLFRACGALGLWRRLRRALTSQGRKPPTRCVDFAYEGRTDVTFGGNWYCQDPICMSDRLHAWAKLVCTCKQLSRLLIARYPVCSTVSEPAR